MPALNIEHHQTTHLTARLLASLMLLQMVLGLLLNFFFLKPILSFDGTTSSEELTFILGVATLVALLISSLNLGFGLLLPKNKVNQCYRLFILLIVFASVGISLCVYEYARLAEYVSFLSNTHAVDFDSNNVTLEYMKKTIATGRNEAHFFSIFISSCSLLCFYFLLLRSSLISKVLSSVACMSVILQLIAVGHTFFELSIPNLLQLPLAITQIIVPIYLFVKGFKNDEATNERKLPAN